MLMQFRRRQESIMNNTQTSGETSLFLGIFEVLSLSKIIEDGSNGSKMKKDQRIKGIGIGQIVNFIWN